MFGNLLVQVRSNPRLRWGLWLILGIVWLYLVLVLRDLVAESRERYQGTIKKIALEQAQAQQKEWLGRVEPAKLLKVQMESRLWQASTSGLAEAAFQDWLNQMLQQAAIGRANLTVTSAEGKPAGESAGGGAEHPDFESVPADLWKIKAKLEFDFSLQSFLAFMTQVGSGDKKTVVESLVIRKEPAPRVEVVLVAYFQKQENSRQSRTKS
jgi:hypothetical protein